MQISQHQSALLNSDVTIDSLVSNSIWFSSISYLSIVKLAASLVEQATINSLVFVNIDASEEIPRSWFFVRGRQNSILLLEPKGEHCTKVTLVIEKDPAGWYVLSPFLASLFSGDTPVLLLRDLKRALEETEEVDKDGLLSVEEIAEKKFRAKLEKPLGESIVDSKSASKEELQATVKLLEERLARITKAERVEKIDLSELRGRVKEDLKKAKKNLSQH